MSESAKAAIIAACITGLLGCVGVTFAAIIGLGLPIVEKWVGRAEPTPAVIVGTATASLTTIQPSQATSTLLPTSTKTPKPIDASTATNTSTPTKTPTLASTPTSTPEPPAPPPPTPTPTTPNGLHYDSFDDDCINKSLWGMFVDGQAGTHFLPTPVGQCWDVGEQGLSEHNGRIDFDHTDKAPDSVQSFLLAEQPGRTFTAVKLDLNVESLSGQWGGVGLFTRLNDANQSWAYYWLRFGGNVPNDQGRVVYDEHETIKSEGDPIFSLATTVTLELRWDGQTMSFYANGSPTVQPVPFSGFSDTFGIYWVTGPSSSLICHVDDFRISWE